MRLWLIISFILFVLIAVIYKHFSDYEEAWSAAKQADTPIGYCNFLEEWSNILWHTDEARDLWRAAAIRDDSDFEIKKTLARLSDEDPKQRGWAATEVGDMGSASTPYIPRLCELLADDTPYRDNFRVFPDKVNTATPGEKASDALAAIGKIAVPYLLHAAKGESAYARRMAIEALDQINLDGEIGVFLEHCTDADSGVRIACLNALAARSPRDTGFKAILLAVSDSETSVRIAALSALSSYLRSHSDAKQLEDALPHVLDSLSNPSPEVRLIVVTNLSGFFGNPLMPRIRQMLLSDPDIPTRRACAAALSRHYAAVPELISGLMDPDDGVRRMSADSLGRLRAIEAIPALIKAAARKDMPLDRGYLAAAISNMGKESVARLVTLLHDKDTDIAKLALSMLERTTGSDFSGDLNAARKHWPMK